MVLQKKIVALLVLSMILSFMLGFYLGGHSPKDTDARGEWTAKPASSQADVFNIGDTVFINGLHVTINDARLEESEAGSVEEHIVIVDVTIENTTDRIHEISRYNMTLIDDQGYGHEHESRINTKGVLGGQLHPARQMRGEIAYLVPSSSGYEFVYTDHLRTGQIVWELDPKRLLEDQ
ncbi:DUF4352 domain-containing protein [Desertibacillus haloalkaliphilus]|uniref:DUF4352 domain-containing protein n=1 Tax=Desertibacillus haloalkaliphilus TaxID=1328930 RepID=UPI001C25CFEF|nr:DUF4352 domain-containing protein [Desertibacillus haloalkaliphilus]MBU8907439.1 DUF4352 domain-containing protein [Desertibacillus haloalkaliphilus]